MNTHKLATIRGQGVEIDTAINGSAVYYAIRGQGITETAGTYVGTRGETLVMLLAPLGLCARDGRIVEAQDV